MIVMILSLFTTLIVFFTLTIFTICIKPYHLIKVQILRALVWYDGILIAQYAQLNTRFAHPYQQELPSGHQSQVGLTNLVEYG